MSEWEPGLDGKPQAPWRHQVVVYLIDPVLGGTFTYLNSTVGARIAWEQLREKVITVLALRNARVVPVVRLTHRPMKTFAGMKHRPEFEIVEWRKPGGDGGNVLANPQASQLTGPESKPPEPKTGSRPSAMTAALDGLEEVSEPSTAEVIKDEFLW
jgi:hypothetical protein